MIMNILVANHHLSNIGGSETFTYTLIEELVRRGYNVEYFTFHKGITSDKIECNLGVKFMSQNKYDLILANHNSCVEKLFSYGYTIQTIHGIYPELEQPSPYADFHIAISNEVQNHLSLLGFPSVLIKNGVNLDRFNTKKQPHHHLKTILSLCQSEEANTFIKEAIKGENIDLIEFNKHQNPIWETEDYINSADMVIGLGRSLYDAMACGRPVICFDNRHQYMDSVGDGYLKDIIYGSINYNCSGRFLKKQFTQEDLLTEIKKYNANDGAFFRNFAEKELDIRKSVNTYLEIYQKKLNLSNLIKTKHDIQTYGKSFAKNFITIKNISDIEELNATPSFQIYKKVLKQLSSHYLLPNNYDSEKLAVIKDYFLFIQQQFKKQYPIRGRLTLLFDKILGKRQIK